ncbi:MAG: hypothetical protein JRD89_14540 [Deltaproteobacteria bacterium]|nr:hypothetical protein [Deltaproteobacteria bacterium]
MIDMKLVGTPSSAEGFASQVLSEVSDPSAEKAKTVDSVSFIANRDSMRMYGFLALEMGDRFTLTEDQTAIDDDFFVLGYRFTIIAGQYVSYDIIPRRAGLMVFWILGTSALGVDTGLGF